MDDLRVESPPRDADVLEGYKETELGLLPEDWDVVPLGEYLSLIRNGLSKKQNRQGAGYPVTRIETISGDKINPEKVAYLEDLSNEQVEKYRLLPGDILFSHINSEPQLGRSVIYRGSPPLLLHGMNLLVLRTASGLDSAFLRNLLSFYRAMGVFIGLAGRAVNQSSINQGKLKAMLIPLPPMSEQQAIAHILRAVQEAIELTEQVIAATRELKRSLMSHLFTYGLEPVDEADHVPLKETEIGPVPEHWATVPIGALSWVQSGGTPSRKESGFYGGNIRWVKTLDLNGGLVRDTQERITEEGFQSIRGKLRPVGTVMIAMYGGAGTIGKSGILGVPAATNQAVCCIGPDPDTFSSEYLLYYFVHIRPTWMKYAIGTRKDPNISKGVIERKIIPFPPLIEQQEIARILGTVDEKMAAEQSCRASLEVLFKSLLHNLMTGKVRVNNLDLSEVEGVV